MRVICLLAILVLGLGMKLRDVNITELLKLKTISRSIDGRGNNILNPQWGGSWTNLIRKTKPHYQDDISQMITNMPNPRFLSQSISQLQDNIPNPNQYNLTMLFGTWGQFLDHDITLSSEDLSSPIQTIPIPRCDTYFDLQCTGNETIQFHRSKYNHSQKIRTNINELTAWIDASQVYGSTIEVMNTLRTFKDGNLKTSSGNLLPINKNNNYFAGDVRAIENRALTCLHIVMLREHNRLCDLMVGKGLTDEEMFGIARNYVIGLMQKISFYDYLPAIFGAAQFKKYIGPYQYYDQYADPSISTEFSSSAYRIGHPYVTNRFKMVQNNNRTSAVINMYDMFISNPSTVTYLKIGPMLKGLSKTLAKERNIEYVDELRNVPPQILGSNFDLFAINTVRGRDHGVLDYNNLRRGFGLRAFTDFSELFADEDDQNLMKKACGSIDNVDPYIGVIAEPTLPGSMYGELGATIAGEQFKNIRNGDRFWFEFAYPPSVIAEIKVTTIADLIMRNSDATGLDPNSFYCSDCTV